MDPRCEKGLELNHKPKSQAPRKRPLKKDNLILLQKEVQELLEKQAIERVPQQEKGSILHLLPHAKARSDNDVDPRLKVPKQIHKETTLQNDNPARGHTTTQKRG